ncbi:MAG TPA: hypothetical protein PLO37_17000 [Candidatus Hydrogenedentes bacterium]|nr:hypothetical protein [Candidatus Hydrogenedentota bacterium]
MTTHAQRVVLLILVCATPGYASALTAEIHGVPIEQWDILDIDGDGRAETATDATCPSGYGPEVLHLRGTRMLAMAKGAWMGDGTIVALYRELDAAGDDADGVILFRAQYGEDISEAHNVKELKSVAWLEQDNDAGLQFCYVDANGVQVNPIERPGFGLVTGEWNVTGWIWQKVRLQGSRYAAKYWSAGTPEPAEWGIEGTFDWPPEGRIGLHIASGDMHLAYFAADAADIVVPPPPAYLVMPGGRTADMESVTLKLFTNLDSDAAGPFELRIEDAQGAQVAAQLDLAIAAGHAVNDVASGALDRTLAEGPCRAQLASASDAFKAEAAFEVLPVDTIRKRLDHLTQLTDSIDAILDVATPDEKVDLLRVITQAARAHIELAASALVETRIDDAISGADYAAEALDELSGYKGAWLREAAAGRPVPEIAIASTATAPDEKPEERSTELLSRDYRLSFGNVRCAASSFSMGRSYEAVIPWHVEGATPDRDFAFEVRLVSPLGNRCVAASNTAPDVPTSQWRPGEMYEQRVTLDVLPEDGFDGRENRSQPQVLDEYHYLVVGVRDPATGASLLLGNAPGPQCDRPGSGYCAREVYIAQAPLEIRELDPESSVVLNPRADRFLVANVGTHPFDGEVVFSAVAKTGRVVYREVRVMTLAGGTQTPVDLAWMPDTAGGTVFSLRVMHGGRVVTEAKRDVRIEPPAGFAVDITKANRVEHEGDRFSTPITVDLGKSLGALWSAAVYADGCCVGQAESDSDAVTIACEPWFGYYDVQVIAGDFRYDQRLVATVVEADGADILVNGEPFIVKGVNVHGMDGGSPDRTAAMMRIMRDLGFNMWRGDYPARWQVDLAYELNTAYNVLAPFSCTSTEEIFRRQAGAPPLTTARELSRVFMARYTDSAGVLFWNSCNEIGGETEHLLVSAYPVYANLDPYRRPVQYANLYGQDFWQGQDVVGVNTYFGRGQAAAMRQPLVARSVDIAHEHNRPVIYDEFNSWYGAVHSTGVEAMRDLFMWGIDRGMAGGFFYMKQNSDRHPGVFDDGLNTHRIMNDAIIEAFADARVEFVEKRADGIALKIVNKRRCTLREVRMTLSANAVPIEPIAMDDIGPQAEAVATLPISQGASGPATDVEGAIEFVTHFGFRCRVPVRVIAP